LAYPNGAELWTRLVGTQVLIEDHLRNPMVGRGALNMGLRS
jgi:hypothetical protein